MYGKAQGSVADNGYGVIGKRVADAVAAQDDMALVGISDIDTDYRIRVATERGYAIFASDPKRGRTMEEAGIPQAGDINALLSQADIVVACAPKKLSESVDAIRALTGLERRAERSIAKTNESLGIVKTFLPRTVHEHEEHPRMSRSSRHFMEKGTRDQRNQRTRSTIANNANHR